MWILISLAIIIVSVAAWAILRVASDADDELDDYGEALKKLASSKHKAEVQKETENLINFNNETRNYSGKK